MNTAPRIAAKMAASVPNTPSYWSTHPSYKGLSRDLCEKMDNDHAQVREYLVKMKQQTICWEYKAETMLELYQYLYTNNLLILREPKFRAATMANLEETVNDDYVMSEEITVTQSRNLRAQHKLWKNKYKEMVSDPLYVA